MTEGNILRFEAEPMEWIHAIRLRIRVEGEEGASFDGRDLAAVLGEAAKKGIALYPVRGCSETGAIYLQCYIPQNMPDLTLDFGGRIKGESLRVWEIVGLPEKDFISLEVGVVLNFDEVAARLETEKKMRWICVGGEAPF